MASHGSLHVKAYYFLSSGSTVFLLPYLYPFFQSKGFTDAQLGAISALRPWVSAVAGTVFPAVADRWQYHMGLMLTMFCLSVLARLSMWLAATCFLALCWVALVSEFLAAPVGVLADAAVVAASEKIGGYGRQRLWASVGWGGLSYPSGLLLDRYGYAAGFILYGALSLPCLLALTRFKAFLSGGKSDAATPLQVPLLRSSCTGRSSSELHSSGQVSAAHSVDGSASTSLSINNSEDFPPLPLPAPIGAADGDRKRVETPYATESRSTNTRTGNASHDACGQQGATARDSAKLPPSPTDEQQAEADRPSPCAPRALKMDVAEGLGPQRSADDGSCDPALDLVPHLDASLHSVASGEKGKADAKQGMHVDIIACCTSRDATAFKGLHDGAALGAVPDAAPTAPPDTSDVPLMARSQPSSAPVGRRPSFILDTLALLSRGEVWLFLAKVFLLGFGAGTMGTWLMIYVASLGASHALQGLMLTANCVAEVPVFHFQQQLTTKFPTNGLLHFSLGVLVLRLLAYVALPSLPGVPWVVLPVELSHGITFALCWGASCVRCKDLAPERVQATMQGLMQSVYGGIGGGCGGLVGAILHERLGGQGMFRVTAVIIGVGWALLSAVELLLAVVDRQRARKGAPGSPLIATN